MIDKYIKNPLVYPALNNAGLGNLLLIWARAKIFAKINSIDVIEPEWNQCKIGSLLRGKMFSRYYGSQFVGKNKYISRFMIPLFYLANIPRIYNPSLEKIKTIKAIYIFNTVPYWRDHFRELKIFQPYLKEEFMDMVNPKILNLLKDNKHPELGVHIRRGDFPVKRQVPIQWYIRVIKLVREVAGYDVPVTLFSDGSSSELNDVLSLSRVTRSQFFKWPVYEILNLSKSKVLIATTGSTFSNWAGFLGQNTIIHYPFNLRTTMITNENKKIIFEGGFDPSTMNIPEQLVCDVKRHF